MAHLLFYIALPAAEGSEAPCFHSSCATAETLPTCDSVNSPPHAGADLTWKALFPASSGHGPLLRDRSVSLTVCEPHHRDVMIIHSLYQPALTATPLPSIIHHVQ